MGVKIDKHDFELVVEFAKNEFKLKYKNSFFGYLWSILNPLLMLVTLYVVFTYAMKINLENYQLAFLLGIIIWNYFSESTMNSLNSLIGSAELIKKNKINPLIIPLSSCLSNLFGILMSLFVFSLILIFFKVEITYILFIGLLYFIPLVFLTLGTSILIIIVYGFFKDITHLWSFFLLIGFWITPIVYSEMIFAESIRKYYMLNPMARVISHFRNAFIYGYFDEFSQILITLIISLSIFYLSILLYEKTSNNFIERI